VNRQAQLAREILGLIEPAPALPPGMKRHGHRDVGADQGIASGHPHERAQPRCDRAPAFVFQRVDDVAQPAFVLADRRGVIDGVSVVETLGQAVSHAGARPAGVAHRAIERAWQHRGTRRAGRFKQRRENAIGQGAPHCGTVKSAFCLLPLL